MEGNDPFSGNPIAMNSHDENAHLNAATDAEGRAASPQLPERSRTS